MSEQLLDDIIQLEKALFLQIEQEKKRIGLWIEQERAALEPVWSQAEHERVKALQEVLAAARELARQAESEQERLVRQYCRRLDEIPTDFLEELLRESLHRLLPED
jgi:hypothetical protein